MRVTTRFHNNRVYFPTQSFNKINFNFSYKSIHVFYSLQESLSDLASKVKEMEDTSQSLNKKLSDMASSSIMMNRLLLSNQNAIQELKYTHIFFDFKFAQKLSYQVSMENGKLRFELQGSFLLDLRPLCKCHFFLIIF